MAISDVLYEAETSIREYQRAGVIADLDDPQLELLLGVMRAARLTPGRDAHPAAPDTFTAEVTLAFDQYRVAVAQHERDLRPSIIEALSACRLPQPA